MLWALLTLNKYFIMSERLQKLIANSGYGSRRWAEDLIKQGKVTLNNKIANIGDKASIGDKVSINNKIINLSRYSQQQTKVIIFNKKAGYICSKKDTEGRKTVFELLPEDDRWIMVGRLDINTSGLLIFTNNGGLANKLMHPSNQIDREYAVRVLGKVQNSDIKKLLTGVNLEDGFAKFHKISKMGGEGANSWYRVVIREGRKREIRRVWEHVGFQVSRLIRIRFGSIILPENLRANKLIYLKPKQVSNLLKSLKMRSN